MICRHAKASPAERERLVSEYQDRRKKLLQKLPHGLVVRERESAHGTKGSYSREWVFAWFKAYSPGKSWLCDTAQRNALPKLSMPLYRVHEAFSDAHAFSHFANVHTNKSSTFFLAHGVFLKKVKLDLMPGSTLKHLISIIWPSSSQP